MENYYRKNECERGINVERKYSFDRKCIQLYT